MAAAAAAAEVAAAAEAAEAMEAAMAADYEAVMSLVDGRGVGPDWNQTGEWGEDQEWQEEWVQYMREECCDKHLRALFRLTTAEMLWRKFAQRARNARWIIGNCTQM